MWRSTNSGTSFTQLANVEEADNIGLGKAAPNQTYVAIYTSAKIGGARGIFRSDNEGVSWVRINDDQHQYAWTGKVITGDPRIYGRVYFGTNGRGIIYGDIQTTQLSKPMVNVKAAEMEMPSESGSLKLSPNPSLGEQFLINYPIEKRNGMNLFVTDANGRTVYQQKLSSVDFESTQTLIRLPKKLSGGVYLVSISNGEKTYSTKLVVY